MQKGEGTEGEHYFSANNIFFVLQQAKKTRALDDREENETSDSERRWKLTSVTDGQIWNLIANATE